MLRRSLLIALPVMVVLASCTTGPVSDGTTIDEQTTLQALELRIAELEASLEEAKSERDAAVEQGATLRSELQAAEYNTTSLRDQVTGLQDALAQLRAEHAGLVDEAEGATLEAQTLALENQNLIRRVDDLEQTIDELLVTQLTFFTQERLLYEDSKYDDLDLPAGTETDDTTEADERITERVDGSGEDTDQPESARTDAITPPAVEPVPFSAAFVRAEFADAATAPIVGSQLEPEPLAGAVRVVTSSAADGTTYYYDNRIRPDSDHLTLVVERKQDSTSLYIQLGRVIGEASFGAGADGGPATDGAPANRLHGTLHAELRGGEQSIRFDADSATIERIRLGAAVTELIRRPVDRHALVLLTQAARGASISVIYQTAAGTVTHRPDQTERLAMVNMLYVFGELGGILPPVAAE